MQRDDDLLADRLDGNGPDLLVAACLQEPLGVGAIGLVAPHVRSDVMWGQEHDSVTESLQLSSPVVRRAARFHHHDGPWLLGHERKEESTRKPLSPYYVTRAIRNRDLKHGLCHVHRDTSIVLHDGLLLLPRQQRLWHIDADSVAGGAHLINAADEARLGWSFAADLSVRQTWRDLG